MRSPATTTSVAVQGSGAALRPEAILDWYAAAERELPWRAEGVSAWGILVSEVMLQQTPVVRVLPIWATWMARWPDPRTLAEDSPGAAVRAWGRLGYPRRARRLHATAQQLVTRFGGEIPQTVRELEGLAGIGAYTARAVAAFAFGVRTPVVDTNVARAVARAVHGRESAGPTVTAADRLHVETLLPAEPARAVRFSAAVMELGALVCTARAPSCRTCPVRLDCAWQRSGGPAYDGPRRKSQRYEGTDRQARGRLLDMVRSSQGPVPAAELDRAWPEPVQRGRALDSLIVDGLVERVATEHFALPGGGGGP